LPESEANDSFWPYHVNHDRKWYIPNHWLLLSFARRLCHDHAIFIRSNSKSL
jgi:hypothetical protein